jgi:hypothetical protein
MSSDIWAITAYFNPMHWRQRQANFRIFREHLNIPLVAVELGYDGQFDLGPGDADILVQIPANDVMWQKERLFNIALEHVPPEVDLVANLDSDICLNRPDVWQEAGHALQRCPIVQLFSQVYYLPQEYPVDFTLMRETVAPCPAFAWLRQQGHSALDLCNPSWANPGDAPPVTYGLAWAFRRELFAERGLYDAWVVGGGTRVHFFAAHGHAAEAGAAFTFHPAMHEHYRQWADSFHREVRGRWGFVPGEIAHLWHGDMARRKHRQRYVEFAEFDFDPYEDLALDKHGAWQWKSEKPAMHRYIREYIAGRKEDELGDGPQRGRGFRECIVGKR